MKVGIVGAGAMGCLIGSFLAKAGEDVWLVDIWKEHISHINSHGLIVTCEGKSDTIPIHATTNIRDVGICDVIGIFTKFGYTRIAIQDALYSIRPNTVVVTIQNGLGNVDVISEFVDEKQILRGLTLLGSIVKGPGEIEATFPGAATYLWPLAGDPNVRVRSVVDALNKGASTFHLSPDVQKRIWGKLCLNAGLSMPLAIPRIKIADFINQASSLELMKGLVYEIVAVAGKEGIVLDPDEEYQRLLDLAKQAPKHLPSPVVDVLNHRKTEIDCLNGAIVMRAKKYGMEVPYNAVIYHLIRIIEDTYDERIQHP